MKRRLSFLPRVSLDAPPHRRPSRKVTNLSRPPHAELDKDKSDIAGRESQFAMAKTFAIDQTRHEWCRLVAMTRAAWGDAGVARLMTWAADTDAASCATP
jgi:hypothetical protein